MGRRALAALAALGLLLAGCDGDPEPRVGEPTSTAPTSAPTSTTPDPTPTEPVTNDPPERETAQEFLRRWQEAANEMQVSGDSGEYRSLSHNCQSCDNFADNVDRIYSAGGRIETTGGIVKRIRRWGKVNEWPTYDMTVASAKSTIYESVTAPARQLDGGFELIRVSLSATGMKWTVRRVTRVVQ